MAGTCSIDGCGKPVAARGWCHAHYKKWQLHGSPHHGKSYERSKGEGTITYSGYVAVTHEGRKRQQHILVAEAALGKPLPAGAVVHHLDHNPTNNDPLNLLICPDQAYHQLIHQREKALAACGNPDFRRCIHCREWDAVENMTHLANKGSGARHYHKECHTKAFHERKAKNDRPFVY
jgi:hypothetical protein